MICKSLEEAARILAAAMVENRETTITVDVIPEILSRGSVLQAVCEADPRLILCIEDFQLHREHFGSWARLYVHIKYTDCWPSSIYMVNSVSEFQDAAYHTACLHGRTLTVVYPAHMYERLQEAKKQLVELPLFLNCFVTGVGSSTKRISGSAHVAQIIRFNYSCTYEEWINRKKEIALKTSEIERLARQQGSEDWKKAYAVVRYCVDHWSYGKNSVSPGLEYTNYGAIVKNKAVCMGISLAVCTIFKNLGIPCRYVHGIRNGTGHGWNMVYLKGGWFYIDVTDAIVRKDPLYHWGMTSLSDRTLCGQASETLVCNCTSEYIRRMIS